MALDPGSLPSSPSQKEQRKEGAVAGSTGAEDQAEEICERDKKKARAGKRGQGVTKRCWDRLGKGGWLHTTPGKPDQTMLTLKTHTAFHGDIFPAAAVRG